MISSVQYAVRVLLDRAASVNIFRYCDRMTKVSIIILFAISTVCWSGPSQLWNKIEIKDRMVATQINGGSDAIPSSQCQEDFLQGDPNVPCWTLALKCYCFSTRTLGVDWNRADRFCRAGNFTLLSIETHEEDRLIHHHLVTELPVYGSTYWTSGKYLIPQWEWASTEPFQPFDYANWYPGVPNNNRPDYCVYLYFDGGFDSGYWRDNSCSTLTNFICEAID
ncbi:L-selectin-like [Daphnia carinata]|uniref:L-selectin-like n=1 Tax=Daphnia carinata TaxID=120202 RepID=UPI0028689808|nr:L-selectin-like [Daphnia carinata]